MLCHQHLKRARFFGFTLTRLSETYRKLPREDTARLQSIGQQKTAPWRHSDRAVFHDLALGSLAAFAGAVGGGCAALDAALANVEAGRAVEQGARKHAEEGRQQRWRSWAASPATVVERQDAFESADHPILQPIPHLPSHMDACVTLPATQFAECFLKHAPDHLRSEAQQRWSTLHGAPIGQ